MYEGRVLKVTDGGVLVDVSASTAGVAALDYIRRAAACGLPVDDDLIDDLCDMLGWHCCEIEDNALYFEPRQ
jgi:hypothetical protein